LIQGQARIRNDDSKIHSPRFDCCILVKRFKRIALRCEKTAQNYGSFVALACAFILIKCVHTT
jgi:hypothetical protein